ncbi:MAG: PspC domain-containing protein [Flavobacteriales bacterium]|jgi:phage shock protein C
MQPSPQLRRPAEDRKIGGVLAGIAKFYGIDVSLLRILVVILALCYGTGVLAYLIAWAIIPGE